MLKILKWSEQSLIFLCLAVFNPLQSKQECSTAFELRKIAEAQGPDYLFFQQGQFHSESFRLTGEIQDRQGRLMYSLALYEVIWGSSRRATRRLLIFNKDCSYLGHYYLHTSGAITIKQNRFLIYRANSENKSIDFRKVQPPQILNLDGSLHHFDSNHS